MQASSKDGPAPSGNAFTEVESLLDSRILLVFSAYKLTEDFLNAQRSMESLLRDLRNAPDFSPAATGSGSGGGADAGGRGGGKKNGRKTVKFPNSAERLKEMINLIYLSSESDSPSDSDSDFGSKAQSERKQKAAAAQSKEGGSNANGGHPAGVEEEKQEEPKTEPPQEKKEVGIGVVAKQTSCSPPAVPPRADLGEVLVDAAETSKTPDPKAQQPTPHRGEEKVEEETKTEPPKEKKESQVAQQLPPAVPPRADSSEVTS